MARPITGVICAFAILPGALLSIPFKDQPWIWLGATTGGLGAAAVGASKMKPKLQTRPFAQMIAGQTTFSAGLAAAIFLFAFIAVVAVSVGSHFARHH